MLIFLIVCRAVSVLRLSCLESWWKDAEILMLRHQLSVALRERPRTHSQLTWPDSAWLALLAGTLNTRTCHQRAELYGLREALCPGDRTLRDRPGVRYKREIIGLRRPRSRRGRRRQIWLY
jgi:hypothetical protein